MTIVLYDSFCPTKITDNDNWLIWHFCQSPRVSYYPGSPVHKLSSLADFVIYLISAVSQQDLHLHLSMCAISYSRPVSNLEKAKYSIGFSCTFVGWLFPRPPCFESPFDVLPSKAISPDTNESRRTFRYRERSDDKLWLLTKMSLLPRRPRKLCLSGCYITPCIQALSTSFKVYINVLAPDQCLIICSRQTQILLLLLMSGKYFASKSRTCVLQCRTLFYRKIRVFQQFYGRHTSTCAK